MAHVVIEPQPIEFGLNRDAYDALAEDLREAGHQVELRRPIERKNAVRHAAFDVQVFLLDKGADALVGFVVGMVVARLSRSRRPRKGPPDAGVPRGARGAIFGPDGDVLREFDIPPPGGSD